jgi:transcriptional regulator with XRE-family HTH domain
MRERITKSIKICADVFDENYAHLHSRNMYDLPLLLRKMMEAIDGGQADLAKKLGGGITQSYISRWMSGAEPKRPHFQRILALAHELGITAQIGLSSEDVADELTVSPPPKMAKLKGYVGASGEAIYYRISDEDLEEVEAPANAPDPIAAVEIKGKSFGPLLNNWIVFYNDVRSPVTPDLIGQVCVVGLADDRVLLKEIRRNSRGGYRLISNNSTDDPIEDARIEWAARVILMRPPGK